MNDVKQVDKERTAWTLDIAPNGMTWEKLTAPHVDPTRLWQANRVAQAFAAHRIAAECAKDAILNQMAANAADMAKQHMAEKAALQARVAELESFARAVLMLESIPLAARTEILSAAQCIGLATEIADVDTHIASLKEPTP